MRHPDDILFAGEKPFPSLPVVDHYAGAEKLMQKAMALQTEYAGQAISGDISGAIFDITLDCEDGAKAGGEREHATMCAELIMSPANAYGRIGARIHDITHPHWQADLEILVSRAGPRLPFLTLPKPRSAADVSTQLKALRRIEQSAKMTRQIPVHVLIETHGALRDIWDIAALQGVESLDFGLMDFVSGHHGAIPGSAMSSPGQFTHPLITRAKSEIAAAALAHGIVPSHNVTTELNDIDLIRDDARRARLEFGYLRMWSIHPKQIIPIIEAMRPDFSEVETASEIILAAISADWGPVSHKGKLHDRASYRYYWELLRRARQTGITLPAEILKLFS